jgi:N-acetylglucosamine-6-phosphate deacetylase
VDVFNNNRFSQKQFPEGTQFFDLKGATLAPGFIDTHIHGFYGYGVEDNSTESILRMSEHLAQFGVTSFFPTIYPQPLDKMIEIVASCAAAMGKETGAKIIGLHLEGPFISPNRLGVQIAENLQMPSISAMERLLKAANGQIRNMTVAPELKGMHELALFCQNHGIVLQAGHTDATYAHMKEGMQVGIMHATHFFNAMSPMHHRDPNAVGAILIKREFSIEVIADGLHVHPDLFKLIFRDKPFEKIVLVTDALKPTQQETGVLMANGEEVYLEESGLFHRKKDDVIAGSSLTMIKGVANLIEFGAPKTAALRMSSSNPARIMGLKGKGTLLPGEDADIVVFDKDYQVLATMVEGVFKRNQLEKIKKGE